MRIPTGVTNRAIPFVALSTGAKARLTGLSSFTVHRRRNGGTLTAMTTPTVTEVSAANAPGVYELLADEDTTLTAGNDTEVMWFQITATGMDPVTLAIELYRPKITAGNTLTVESDGMGHADVKEWLGVAPLALASQRVQVDTVAFGGSAGTFASGRPEVNTTHLGGTSGGIQALSRYFLGCVLGTSDSGTTTTMVDAALTQADVDFFKGSTLYFVSGNLLGQSRLITAFDPTTDTITFTPAVTQSVGTLLYIIIPTGTADVQAWLGAVPTATPDAIKAETADIVADTNELQGEWADGGRLDLILDARASQTSVDGVPTTAEFEARTLAAAAYFDPAADTVTVGTNNDKTDYRLSATGVDDVLDEVVEGTTTLRQSIRLNNSAQAGKLSGAGTTSIAIRDLADSKDRVAATVDASGNRSAVTTDLT